jgi:hypothetical protein
VKSDREQEESLLAVASDQELFILWLLTLQGEVGRYRLAKMLDVPQGVARGVFARMKRRGLITVRHRTGASSTRKGTNQLRALMERGRLKYAKRLGEEVLGLGQEGVIFQVGGCSNKIIRGIEQRDAAVRAGATGAVTFIFDGRTLIFPDTKEPVTKRSFGTFQHLRKRLKMRKGDAVLIAFGNSWWDAARGGFAAVRTLA